MTTYNASQNSTIKPLAYSRLQIGLHWLIAALVIFQLYFGESMTAFVDALAEGGTVSPFDQQVAWLHYWVGISVLALVAVRLVVRLSRGSPSHADVWRGWTDVAARFAHGLFYALLVAVPVTGLVGYYYGSPFGDLHAWAKPVFVGLIAVHGLAAVYHQFWVKDGTLSRMLKAAK